MAALHKQIEELTLKIKSTEEERRKAIETEVGNAVRAQEQNFNNFLRQFESDLLQKFTR